MEGTPLGTLIVTPIGTHQPQAMQRTPSQEQGCTTPSAYADCQQQWATVVEDNRRDGEGLMESDGRERGSRPKEAVQDGRLNRGHRTWQQAVQYRPHRV